MGEFIKMIPIAITALILASLLESFVFLPMHAKHILKKHDKELNWSKFNNFYKKILSFLIRYEKTSVALFLIIIPLLIFFGFKYSKFQFFPKFDGTQVFVSGKMDINTKVEDTFKIAKEVEKRVLAHKSELFIESTSVVAGFRMDATGRGERGEHLMFIFIDLKKTKPKNFVEKYINPYLSIDYDDEDRVRELDSYEVAKRLNVILKNVKGEFNFNEFEVTTQKAGVVKNDIEVGFVSDNDKKLISIVKKVKNKLQEIKGVENIVNDAQKGISEIKIKINPYGEQLGITEGYLAKAITNYYLKNTKAKSFDKDKIVDIIIYEKDKDNIYNLKNFQINIPGTLQKIALKDITTFLQIQNFEKIKKIDSKKRKTVYADVDTDIITANEVLRIIKPFLKEIEKNNKDVIVELGGEAKQNKQLAKEMGLASAIAVFLIFMTLLIMFDSFKYTFMILSIIPLSLLGMLIGHFVMGLNITMPSLVGALGLAGVVINDGIIMIDFIRNVKNKNELLLKASHRLRPIMLTSITTLIGLMTLIFFPTGQAVILQPLAISLGYGLFWGTVLNLLYLPTLFAIVKRIKND